MDNIDKLKHYAIAGGFDTQVSLAAFLDIDPARISEWKKGKPVQEKYIKILEKEFGIIEKDGDTIKFIRDPDHIPTHLAKRVTENAVIKGDVTKLDTPDLIPVPIISAVGEMALEGIEHFEVEVDGQLLIDRIMFKILPNLNNIQALRVDGDSMLPTLKPDDYVIIELGDVFSGEGIYALQWDSMLFVKRLQASEQRGVIDIISDNQSFPVKQFNPKDDQRAFNIIGKVILRIQR
jgi:SOS-response transcriptional repressor LexA